MPTELLTKEHVLSAPLFPQSDRKIEVFAREVYQKGKENADIVLFLQGGPGFQSPRNIDELDWVKELTKRFRVVLLDQRGTGRSTKVGPETPQQFDSAESLAEYLSHFRADNIVRDAEALREQVFKVKQWYLLGQSFGGFASITYLSMFPQSLKAVMITGGLPPLPHHDVATIYQRLLDILAARNDRLYKTFPQLAASINHVAELLSYDLPDTGVLTRARLRDIGTMLGRTNGLQRLFYLFDDPFFDSDKNSLCWAFAKSIISVPNFDTNPIYAVLHESIYCHNFASNWAADHILQQHNAFQNDNRIYFYGETIRRAMFEEYFQLRDFQAAADILAQKEDWPVLYDVEQLADNKVPVVALVYEDDFYVDPHFSMETAGAISGCQVWKHPTWQHDSLRTKGKEVIKGLLKRLGA